MGKKIELVDVVVEGAAVMAGYQVYSQHYSQNELLNIAAGGAGWFVAKKLLGTVLGTEGILDL